jgi:hypothetical protein
LLRRFFGSFYSAWQRAFNKPRSSLKKEKEEEEEKEERKARRINFPSTVEGAH